MMMRFRLQSGQWQPTDAQEVGNRETTRGKESAVLLVLPVVSGPGKASLTTSSIEQATPGGKWRFLHQSWTIQRKGGAHVFIFFLASGSQPNHRARCSEQSTIVSNERKTYHNRAELTT